MDDSSKRCIACDEVIRKAAKICPHCRSAQQVQHGKRIAEVFKFFSYITIIFSLLFGAMELKRFTNAWLENSAYADRLANAAALLADAGDLNNAWALIDDALKIYPTSKRASALQIKLAMARARQANIILSAETAKPLKESLNALLRNLDGSPATEASVLAHIAWATYLMRDLGYAKINILHYLEKALSLDPGNVYANTFMGYWYIVMQEDYGIANKATREERVNTAQRYFATALASNTEKDFVRAKQLTALRTFYNPYAAAAFVKLVLQMKAQNDSYFLKHEPGILKDILDMLFRAWGYDAENDSEYMERVFLALNDTDRKIFYAWLNSNEQGSLFVALDGARLNEKNANYKQAIEQYIAVYQQIADSGSALRFKLPKLIHRNCQEANTAGKPQSALCTKFEKQIAHPDHLS